MPEVNTDLTDLLPLDFIGHESYASLPRESLKIFRLFSVITETTKF